jgi:plasmid stability protein
MASITIRNLDDTVRTRLRIQAATHGKSMEHEARDILTAAVSHEPPLPANLATAIHAHFAPLGGLELPELLRQPIREPPTFG